MINDVIPKLEIISSKNEGDNLKFYCNASTLKQNAKILKSYDFILLDATAIDYLTFTSAKTSRFALVYIFRNITEDGVVVLKTYLNDDDLAIETISDIYKSADWMEREIFDQYGIKFLNHKNLKRILNHQEFIGHPLRKDYDIRAGQLLLNTDSLQDEMDKLLKNHDKNEELKTKLMFLNIGPAHPATHGTIRNLLALDGEKVIECVSEIGYLHRGFEKSCENHSYNQIIPYTDRLNYCSAILNNIGFCHTVEEMLEIKIPDRAAFARMIVGELSRIIDHLVCIGAICVDSGALTGFWYLFNPRESAYAFLSRLCGARLTNTYTRIGGVAYDFFDGFEIELQNIIKEILDGSNEIINMIERNRLFLDRVSDICTISKEEALRYSLSGPNARASGVDFDLRRDRPYYFYDSVDFDVILGSKGDVFDRIMVRFYEIKESIKIINQALKMMPKGEIMLDDAKITLPKKSEVYGSIEGLIRQFELVFGGVKLKSKSFYSATEAANGELGFFIVSDGSGTPYKVKVKPPCFNAMSAYASSVKGYMLSDCILHLGSLNIIAGELDR